MALVLSSCSSVQISHSDLFSSSKLSLSESSDPVCTLWLRMVFVDMNAIDFYKQPSLKTGLSNDKWPLTFNCNVLTIGQQCDDHQAFESSNQSSWRHQDYDLIEIQNIITSSLNEFLDSLSKLESEVEVTEVNAEGKFLHFSIQMMVDDFTDMANKPCVIH